MNKYLIQVVIDVCDFQGDPSSITAFLGIEPTSTSVKGQIVQGGKHPRRRNMWLIYSTPSEAVNGWEHELTVHWENLLEKISGKEKLFAKLSIDAKIKMTIILQSRERYPPVILNKQILAFAHAANFEYIDVDVYQ